MRVTSRYASKQPSALGDTAVNISVRSAEAHDALLIQSLVDHLTEELFGPFNILNVIEKALFAVSLVESGGDLVGFAAFFDYPPPSTHISSTDKWADLIKTQLNLSGSTSTTQSLADESLVNNFTSLNTLFLHLFVTKTDYAVGSIQEIVKAVNASVPDCAQIMMCVPVGSHPDPAISNIFKPINKTIKASSTSHATFYVSYRHEIAPVLYVRPAQMEDNDDLTPIFAQQSNQLQQVYGDYFVAELIDSQDEEHHALCGEKDGRAVGLMSLSSNVNIHLLNQAFELRPFHGLTKPHKDDVLEPPIGGIAQATLGSRGGAGELNAAATSGAIGTLNRSELETTLCVVGGDSHALNQFINQLCETTGADGTVVHEEIEGVIRQVTVECESFGKNLKLNLKCVLHESLEEHKRSTNHIVNSADGIILVFKPVDMTSVDALMQTWARVTGSDEGDSPTGSEVDFGTGVEQTVTTVDHVDSEMVVMASGGNSSNRKDNKGEQVMKLFLADVTDTETADDNATAPSIVEDLAADNGVGLIHADFGSGESVKMALDVIVEAVSRSHFGLHSPSIQDEQDEVDYGATGVIAGFGKMPVELNEAVPSFVPEYNGESNCFCIQLFCIQDELETRSLDFMAKAFECYPDKDYCVITVPHMVPEFMLLQQFVRVAPRVQANLDQELYIFNRYGLLPDFNVRASIAADYDQVEVLTQSIQNGERILADLKQYNEARRDKDGTPLHAYSACVNKGEQVVGVAIVRQEEGIEYLKSHFNIEDFIYYSHHQRQEHGHLHHLIMNPTFHHLTKTFLKEIMRMDGKTCLYYPVSAPQFDPEDGSVLPDPEAERHTLVTCLGEMVPIRPRKQISYPIEMLHGNVPSERVLKEMSPFALYSINRKLVLEPKIAINARVVIVGASDTSVAFLESLVFSPHLKFNNITLVSPHGLPGELPVSKEAQQFLAQSLSFTRERLSRMSLRSWVTVVLGKMVAIDRKSKKIHVRNTTSNKTASGGNMEVLSYDHLVLATGTQYQTPFPAGIYGNKDEDDIRKDFTKPVNVFTVNDEYEADHMVYYIKSQLAGRGGGGGDHVIVYANNSSLDVYGCIRTLLNCGVKGERIILARKAMEDNEATCFNNPLIDEMMDNEVRVGERIRVLNGCELYSWQLKPLHPETSGNTESVYVTEVSLKVDEDWETYSCDAIINFDEKRVDYDAFKAVNDSCLVFDSRVVIDGDFHTNDVCIRAAGPLTKFSRRYHADEWSHANFNSQEVGTELALSMLRLFDPTIDIEEAEEEAKRDQMHTLIPLYQKPKVSFCALPGELFYLHIGKPDLAIPVETARQDPNYLALSMLRLFDPTIDIEEAEEEAKRDQMHTLIPLYQKPKVSFCALPGELFYLHIGKPDLAIPVETARQDPNYGKEYVTGSLSGVDGGYFMVHVNAYNTVESITCVSSEPIPCANLISLYGKNEKMLNKMVSRFNEGLISDFYVYFSEPWAMALFHDRFEDLLQEIRDILTDSPPAPGGGEGNDVIATSFAQKVRAVVEENMEIKPAELNKLMSEFQSTGYKKAIETRLLAYLSYNYYHLPMYAKPGMV